MSWASRSAKGDRLCALPEVVMVELTSRCNLRCVYCATSLPEYEGRDLTELDADLIDEIAQLHPREVQLNGHGETTVLRGWQHAARALLQRGLPIALTTNMTRAYDADELDVLARMAQITISADTSDSALFARLRCGGRLESIEQNLGRLYAHCRDHFRLRPHIAINAVVMEETLAGLPQLARWVAGIKAQSLSLVNFIPYDERPGAGERVRHPADVDARRARRVIAETRSVAQGLGLAFNVMPGLTLQLELADTA